MKYILPLFLICTLCFAGPFGLNWAGSVSELQADGSVKISDDSKKGGSYVLSQDIKINASKDWKFTCNVRCENVKDGRTQIYIRIFDANGKELKIINSDILTGTQDWTQINIVISAKDWPAGASKIRIMLQPAAGPAEGTGTAWFKDLSYREADFLAEPPFGLNWAGSAYRIEDNAIFVEDTSTEGGNYIESNKFNIDTAKAFKLSLEMRCKDVTSRTQVYLMFCDGDGNRLKDFGTKSIDKTTDWTPVYVEVQPDQYPEGTKTCYVIMQPAAGPGEGTGKAWFRRLKYGAVEEVKPIQGHECTEEFLFKYNDITILNSNAKAFPFEHAPANPRLEIVRISPEHMQCIQIITEEKLGNTLQVAPWLEGVEKYAAFQNIPLQKVSRGYIANISMLPMWRKLALLFPGKRKLVFEDVQLSRVEFSEENWKASWIWFTTDRVEMIHVFLRKEFELKEAPVTAMWQCAVDDGGTFYFNGNRPMGMEGRFNPPNRDVASLLKAGKNTIAVEVSQGRYAAGFLGELDMTFADGSKQKLITDKSWGYYPSDAEIRKESEGGPCKRPPEDWIKPEYDSSAWAKCVELGVPPLGAWGKIAYKMNGPRAPVYLSNSIITRPIVAGEQYRTAVSFKVDKPFDAPTPVRLQVLKNNHVFLEWEIGIAPAGYSEAKFPVTINLSKFIRAGEYQLKIVMAGYVATDMDGHACDIQNFTVLNDRKAVPVDARVRKDANGVPTIYLDDKPVTAILSARGNSLLTQHSAMFNSGKLHLYYVYLTPYWPKEGEPDYTNMDVIAENLLRGDPEAKAIIKIQLRDGKPSWYLNKYPEDAIKFDNGKIGGHISLASRRWKNIVADYIKGLIAYVDDSPYADHFIGVNPSEGEEGQWMHYWGGEAANVTGALSDYSKPMLDYFRGWLRREYKTVDALQKAWNDPNVTFDTAEIPSNAERCDGVSVFRRFPKNRKAADFGWALSDVISEGINFYAKTIKEASNGKKLTGAMYGHLMDLGGGFLGEQVGYARQRLAVETPYIDLYLGPISYSHRFRDIGYPGGYDMPSPGSLELHNKIWINENDLRTHNQWPAEYAYSVRTPFDTTQQIAREYVKALCGRAGFYYFPLGDTFACWFDDPETIETIREMAELGEKNITGDRSSISEVAVFFDDETQCRLRQIYGDEHLSINSLAIMQREAVFRIGCPVDEYLQFDIANPSLPKYKLYIFLNPYFLKPAEIAAIQSLSKRDDAKILFTYLPGIANDFDTSIASRLTGINFKLFDKPIHPDFRTSRAFGSLPAGLNYTDMYYKGKFAPYGIPSDFDEKLSEFSDGTPAVVRKGNIYVSPLAMLPVEMLRYIAKSAGVYTFSENNIAVYACKEFCGFHSTKETRPCVFRAPAGKKILQIWPVDEKAQPVTEYIWNNSRPITRIFKIQ